MPGSVRGSSVVAVGLALAAGAAAPALAGTTERVSVAPDGRQANGASGFRGPAVSADGRLVAFASVASNLVPGDTNGSNCDPRADPFFCGSDVFVRDRVTGTTERVSVATSGAQGNADSLSPAISADGRFVAFSSDATNLVPRDTNGITDVFVHDRRTRRTERVSIRTDGAQARGPCEEDGPCAGSFSPSLSADGRLVAFGSSATNLAPGDTNGTGDVFVHDRRARTTERVSVATGGAQGSDHSGDPAISADGRVVAFSSLASDLVPGDAGCGDDADFLCGSDVFVRDRAVGTTERVSVATGGARGNAASGASEVAISADGRVVAFASEATDLVPGDTNGVRDVFVRRR